MASALRSFQDVLSAAIDDLMLHGYDSAERVERWKAELTLAAARQVGDPEQQAQVLRDALAAIYRREVDQLKILRSHAGEVPRFTIEKVKPQLRDELDRRLQASASLVKNGQAEAVAKVMRRWEGWATSIPPGGVSVEKKSAVKQDVQKSLKQLPFEERRILIDQGHKMVSALSEIIASDGGAIAGRWRSNWRQAGYDYRVDHKDRDEKVFLIRDSWAHQAGLVRKGGRPYYDEIDAPGQAVFCRCYMIWLYNLRDLPEDMLTKEGRRKLTEVGMHTNATRAFARSDDATIDPFDARNGEIMQQAANYMAWWPTRPVRCVRCSMFVPGIDPLQGYCTAVAGPISFLGHCRLFEIQGARTDFGRAATGYPAQGGL